MLFKNIWEQLLGHLTNIATFISDIAIRNASFRTVVNDKWFIIIWQYSFNTISLIVQQLLKIIVTNQPTDITTYVAAD